MSHSPRLIAFDATPLHGERSGIAIYTENLIRSLGELEDAPRIVLLSNRAPAGDPDPPARYHPGPQYPLRAVWMQVMLPRLLEQIRPDLCHFPNYLAPLRTSCPRIVTVHDMSLYRYPQFFSWRKRTFARQLLPQVIGRAEGIITVSHHSQREITELLGVPRRKIHVIHEAASPGYQPVTDPATRAAVRGRYGLPERYVLCLGTFEPRKNLRRLLVAFEGLAEKNPSLREVRLVLAGASGWKNRHLRELIEVAQSRERVLDLGYFPQRDLPALYSMAEVVAYPSLYEGFGLPILEAMACGAPVVTSNRSSMPEVAGRAAQLVDPEDVASIRQGLETVLSNPDLARELSQRGLERARQFSWRKAAEQTQDVYEEVLRAPSAGIRTPVREVVDGHVGPAAVDPAERAGASSNGGLRGIQIRRAVLRTVVYADLFESPIEIDELHRLLIGMRASREDLERCLLDAETSDLLTRRGNAIALGGRDSLFDRQERQRAQTRALIGRHRTVLALLSRIPFLRLLAFSGGTAHENSPSHQDVDLFVVAESGRIWTVYGWIILWARLFGQRRSICSNYLVDTDHLPLTNEGDLFTAHELLSLKPLVGETWAERLLSANPWIREIFPNATQVSRQHLAPRRTRSQRLGEVLLAPLWSLSERLSRRVFQGRLAHQARSHPRSAVLLDGGVLKLHLQDRRIPAVERYRQRLQELGLWDLDLEHKGWIEPRPAVEGLGAVDTSEGLASKQRVSTPGTAEEGPSENGRSSPSRAWDAVAPEYDNHEASNGILRELRQRFHAEVDDWVEPGHHVLDLGCGTGIDTLWLLSRGQSVTAIDVSPAMIRIVEKKVSRLREDSGRVEARVLALDELGQLPIPAEPFDAAIANFGALNCLADPRAFSRTLAPLIRPGGHLVAAVMNRTCIWEIVHHLGRMKTNAAFRRWSRNGRASTTVANVQLDIWYPTPRGFAAAFAPEFDLVRVRAHGLFLPPPYLDSWLAQKPRVYRRLATWEDRWRDRRTGAALADHFVMVLRRRGSEHLS